MSSIREYNGILIDYSRDALIPEKGLAMLTQKGFYKKDWEESPQEAFARAAVCYCFGDYEFAQRIYDYVSKQYFMYASPVLSNAVDVRWPTFLESEFEAATEWLAENVLPDGMPISCFLSFVGDKREMLVETRKETAWLSMSGGGIGIKMGNRSPDEKSTGVMAHLKGYDADALSYKQSHSRRGSIAAYLDITHPEIISFLEMRNPVGGDFTKKCFNLNNAVCITDDFMNKAINGEDYELIDPKHRRTGKFLNARYVWETLMQLRFETGEPYICFIDTANRLKPQCITNPLYYIRNFNLCAEITLMADKNRTAVCCLSSLNIEKYDEWKDTNIVADLVRFLDNVLEYFIQLAPKELHRAIYSAQKERAIGLGAMGVHSYFQSKMIPFESGGLNSASQLTDKIFKSIKEKAVEESKRLAVLRGEPDDCVGSGFRNSHLLAIAPNASSSDLIGTSPSIEPLKSNAFVLEGRAGSYLIKNKYLEKYLESVGKNTKEFWNTVVHNDGSIQDTDLPQNIKDVFKTAYEINPMWIVELASIRQEHICQSQSVNIFVKKDITLGEMSDIHFYAWKKRLKSLYYCRAEGHSRANVSTGDKPLNSVDVKYKIEYNSDTCLSCEG